MKSPDAIKKSLDACSADECHGAHRDCEYTPSVLCVQTMCGDALAYIQQLEAAQPHANEPQWIGAETPPTQTNDKDGYAVNYLIYDPKDGVDIGCYIPEVKTWFCAGMPSNVTHWAPLPQPPKEEEHEENG